MNKSKNWCKLLPRNKKTGKKLGMLEFKTGHQSFGCILRNSLAAQGRLWKNSYEDTLSIHTFSMKNFIASVGVQVLKIT